jgi:hypothetical protein
MTSSRLLLVHHHQDKSGAWLLGTMEVQMLVLYTVYSPHFHCHYYSQMDIMFEIQIKKTGWKIQTLPFLAIEDFGLMSCEMLMS